MENYKLECDQYQVGKEFMRAAEFLIERATSVLFHYTSTGAALKILKSGQFELASITGNRSEVD